MLTYAAESSKSALPTKVKTVGEHALAILEKNASARVHSVFHHAVNILTNQDQMITLLEFEEAPWAITLGHEIDFVETGIRPSTRASLQDDIISFESGPSFELREAHIWDSLVRHSSETSSIAIRRSAFHVISLLRIMSRRGGLGSLLIAQKESRETIDFVESVRPRIISLITAVIDHRLEMIRPCASTVAGLGKGSTPSGDDFLLGLLLSLRSFTSSPNQNYVDHVCQAILDGVRGRTNIISQNLIEYSSAGMATGTMLDFLEAYRVCDEKLIGKTCDVLRYGETSGEDTLVGVVKGSEASLAIG